MYMSEDYNSPQSPYWALKSFLALGLPATHPFWTAEEKILHSLSHTKTIALRSPMHIIYSQPNHHFLLSMGQFCPWPLKATEAKYGKFAYSSHFGFSVPTGPLIQQMAPDSTLALSRDGGETWRVPWKVGSDGLKLDSLQLITTEDVSDNIPCLKSIWKPWSDADIEVVTYLVAPSAAWPDWHVRWHRITNKGSSAIKINAVQGGFAIQGRGDRLGENLPVLTNWNDFSTVKNENSHAFPEGILQSDDGVLICSNAGASGIRLLDTSGTKFKDGHPKVATQPEVLKPDANTNLIWQRTLIPTIKVETAASSETVSFGCAVFALARTKDREETYAELDIAKLWDDVPALSVGREQNEYHKPYIMLA